MDFNLLEQRFQKGGKSLQRLLLVGGTEGFKRGFADGVCGFGDGRDVLSRKRVVNPSVAVDDAQVFRRLIAVAVGGGDDSVAALTPKAEIEGDMGDSHVGLQARLMSQALRASDGQADKLSSF